MVNWNTYICVLFGQLCHHNSGGTYNTYEQERGFISGHKRELQIIIMWDGDDELAEVCLQWEVEEVEVTFVE